MKISPKRIAMEQAQFILRKYRIDPRRVNLKEDGVSFNVFSVLVEELYLTGYQDGMANNSSIEKMDKIDKALKEMKKRRSKNQVDSGMRERQY